MGRLGKAILTAILNFAIVITGHSDGQVEDRVLIGAYDPAQINGLVFVSNDENFFGLRFIVSRPGSAIEERAEAYEYGPNAPDGSYASINWKTPFDKQNPIIFRWCRVGKNVIIGRLTAPTGVRVTMEAYIPENESRMAFLANNDRRSILGEQVQNSKAGLRKFFLRTDRPALEYSNYDDQVEMRKALANNLPSGQRQFTRPGLFRYAGLTYDITEDPSFGFIAMVGDDFDTMEREATNILQKPIAGLLDQAENNFRSTRSQSGGALGESLDAVSRMFNWNRFYDSEKQLEYIALNRSSGRVQDARTGTSGSHTVLSWDSLLAGAFGAMLGGNNAASTIRTVLEGQLTDGRVPLRRHMVGQPSDEPATLSGRSMPPIGALCVWKVYLETGDLELLAWAYPRLLRWNEWWLANRGDGKLWRDGNGDGLIEWGYDAEIEQGTLGARTLSSVAKTKLALSESGIDERPILTENTEGKDVPEANFNDTTHTIELTPVGLNSLYALDTEILMMMARELGVKADAEKLEIRYERLRTYINNRLWSEADGLYFNRRWDDRFSRRLFLENFYPLIAGLPGDERAMRMVNTLLDPKKFWSNHLLPFLARDDPAYAPESPGRGAIWPVSNYLLYLALRRYGYYDVAAELSRRSVALGRAAWETDGKFFDYYSSADGRPIEVGGGKQRGALGWLMFWPGIEELINADPWSGLAIGSLSVTEEAKVERLSFIGAKLDVILGPKKTEIKRDGEIELEFEAPVRLYQYRKTDYSITFIAEAKEQTQVKVKAVEGRKITVSVDDKVLGSTSPGASANFKVLAGKHKVLILK
jgi:mannosylglycerate hydrolase MGH1-like protein